MHVFFALGLHQLKLASLRQEHQKYSTSFKSGNITRLLCTLDSGGHLILNTCYTKSRSRMPGEDVSSWCGCPEVFCRDDGGRRQLRAGRAASAWALGSTRLLCCRYAEKAEGSTLKCFFEGRKDDRSVILNIKRGLLLLLDNVNSNFGGIFQASGEVLALDSCLNSIWSK